MLTTYSEGLPGYDDVVRLRAPADFKAALAAAACARGISMSALIRQKLHPVVAAAELEDGESGSGAPPNPDDAPSAGRYVFLSGDPRVHAFVTAKTGEPFASDCASLGVEDNGEIIAGFLFTGWTNHDVTLTLAVNGSLPRAFLQRVADYVWGELGCSRVTIETEQEHVASLALRMGGKVEGVKRDFYGPGRSATVFGILKADWFLAKPRHKGGSL